ncbi:putative membrane protein [Gottschalkia acidurici 9a]|uniref:Membrane protein n=1 Tax=Gottschalkia acidurici (strain ATCC 7906 / DSM 604 / BCRC 14475 / CIP 104303 / KCTC 5404 / NCIMB 10678 / 9a) TaxID=1128398 RepID=K0AVR2_GOTA9|nr:hypothetical protein [Gottschalkia acidurici]AFS77938.1 putative membrane protein [Gottschalkia acidurici 9a]
MKSIKTGRFTLAVLLMALGFTILLQKFIGYNIVKLFSMLWPSIIMLFGLEIIINNLKAKNQEDINVKLDIISTSLVVAIVSSIAMTSTTIQRFDNVKEHARIRHKYEKSVSNNMVLKGNKKIILNDSYSDIIVKKSNDDEVKVYVSGTYKYDDIDKEKKATNNILKINEDGNITEITSTIEKKAKGNYINDMNIEDVRYILIVPKNVDIEIKSDYSAIEIEDVENSITISSNYSDIRLEDINGDIDLKVNYGYVKAENIVGNINIHSQYCENNIESSFGNIYISSNGGSTSLKLEKAIDKDVEIYCDYSDVNIELPSKQKGKFNIVTTYGTIYDNIGFNIIESASSSSINETRQNLKPLFNVRVNNGNITLKTN